MHCIGSMTDCIPNADGTACINCGWKKPAKINGWPRRNCGKLGGENPDQSPTMIGPGTELKKLLRKFGIVPTPRCKCDQRAMIMDAEGPDWCRENLDTICDWMREEAEERKLPFSKLAARAMVMLAIHKARKKLEILEER